MKIKKKLKLNSNMAKKKTNQKNSHRIENKSMLEHQPSITIDDMSRIDRMY